MTTPAPCWAARAGATPAKALGVGWDGAVGAVKVRTAVSLDVGSGVALMVVGSGRTEGMTIGDAVVVDVVAAKLEVVLVL
ncbi:MAG: hypothetical protein M1832_002059 [Thelocarpon impressellum]|nr:MAG: hypothetical protein M1832_002059 [Thelocarpon impressellum]